MTGLRGHVRRDSFQHIADQRRQDHAARIKREAEERREVREAHRALNWQAWLEVATRDVEAVTALRALQPKAARPDNQPTFTPGRMSTRRPECATNQDLRTLMFICLRTCWLSPGFLPPVNITTILCDHPYNG